MSDNGRKCVVFLTMSPRGALQLEAAQMAVAVNTAIRELDREVDSYLATLDANNDTTAWKLVKSAYDDNHILSDSGMVGLMAVIEKLFNEYECVLLEFAGGMQTLKHLIPLKKKYGNRFRIIASVWYYRNGTWLSGICSLMFAVLYLKYVDKVVFGCPYASRNFTLSSLLFRKGNACIMPLAGTSSDEGDEDVAWKILAERKLEGPLKNRRLFKIVYMAQLRPGKNHVWLTKALIPVLKECPDIHVIYCGGEGGVTFEQIKALACTEKLEDRFHLPGRVPYEAVPTILKNVDCSIVPSSTETYGFTYIEPMVFGVPVLGTRVGVGEYAIQDYYNGLSFTRSSIDDFQQKVRFLVRNRELTIKMGENAKRFATEAYTMPRVAAMRASLYREIFARG